MSKNFSLFLSFAAVALSAVRQSSLRKAAVGAVLLTGMLGMNSLKAGEPGESWEYPGGLTPPPPTVTALYVHVFGSSWDDFNLWFEVLPVYTVTGGIEVIGDTVLNVLLINICMLTKLFGCTALLIGITLRQIILMKERRMITKQRLSLVGIGRGLLLGLLSMFGIRNPQIEEIDGLGDPMRCQSIFPNQITAKRLKTGWSSS